MSDIYDICPVLETDSFTLRLVTEADAADLLACYSDPLSQAVFDFENCTSDFCYTTMEEMTACIRFWLREYAQRMYVRFAIVDKRTQKAIVTKGKPIAAARVSALKTAGYAPYDWNDPDRAHYYGKVRG